MGSTDQVQHYAALRDCGGGRGGVDLRDLNAVAARHGDVGGVSDVDREAVTDDESNSVDCMPETCDSSLNLHGVGFTNEQSVLDSNSRCSSPQIDIMTTEDVMPIETARARFLELIINHFISQHVIEVSEPSGLGSCIPNDKMDKRKPRDVRYEGDQRFALPLMYVANLYETLVGDVNNRLASLNWTREKNIGVALEAAGGLYRNLIQKFPKKGPFSFKRRELQTSHSTRLNYPELVVQGEKRIRFVVINGLAIIQRPKTMTEKDACWFRRLTGRNEVAIHAKDYKFYSPRHKYRRTGSPPLKVSEST